jgi:hypothetical protein
MLIYENKVRPWISNVQESKKSNDRLFLIGDHYVPLDIMPNSCLEVVTPTKPEALHEQPRALRSR